MSLLPVYAAMAADDWGPLAGPWVRYSENPILPKEGDRYTVGMCPGTDSIIQYNGKWWMFIYNQDGHNTKLAVSEDGLDWEYVHKGAPILKAEQPWEGSYALTKAVEVIDGRVYLYYMGKSGVQERIGIATNDSPDLLTTTWTKHPENPVFSREDLAAPVQRVFPSSVIEDGGIYYGFFDSGYDYNHPKYPRQYTLNVTSSKDGIHFKELAADIIAPGPAGNWDSQAVSQAAVRKIGDWWFMIYSGFPKGASKSAQAFGLARARKPEGPWEKYPNNPIFTATGAKEDWDGEFLQHACPVQVNGEWRLYYSGNDLDPKRNVYRIGVAMRSEATVKPVDESAAVSKGERSETDGDTAMKLWRKIPLGNLSGGFVMPADLTGDGQPDLLLSYAQEVSAHLRLVAMTSCLASWLWTVTAKPSSGATWKPTRMAPMSSCRTERSELC